MLADERLAEVLPLLRRSLAGLLGGPALLALGPALAVDDLSFTARPGQVTGFVGPNGAGKSTTMRILLGLDAADQGRALVGGRARARVREAVVEGPSDVVRGDGGVRLRVEVKGR